jgi:hypothetical protein
MYTISSGGLDFATAWCIANLALQSLVGILPERGIGLDCHRSNCSFARWTTVTPETPDLKVIDWL